jgi:predicted nucleotidyltransferase
MGKKRTDGEGELLVEKIIEVLEGFPQVLFSTLFGSAAKGRMTVGSDVDIAVAACEALSIESRGELASALSLGLGREVDLIDLQAVSGLILEQALCTGKIVKNADHDLYARLLKRLWYNQADMMPYYRRILEQRNSQWLQQ